MAVRNTSNNIVALLLALLCCCAPACAKTLQLYYEQFPPYNYQEDGKMLGINSEIIQAICQDVGVDCEFTLFPWTRAFNLAKTEANAGVFSTGMSSERRPQFQWVGPLAASNTSLYKLKSRTDIKFSDETGLRAYSVAVVRDTITKQI